MSTKKIIGIHVRPIYICYLQETPLNGISCLEVKGLKITRHSNTNRKKGVSLI